MNNSSRRWALILGASSGFGAATAIELAKKGLDICGVHLDRRSTAAQAEQVVSEIHALGREAHFFNVNAVDNAKRQEVLDYLARIIRENPQGGSVQVLFHSLAFGTLKPLCGEDAVSRSQLEMTLDVMANSLVYWSQDLLQRKLIGAGGRIFAMTSAGARSVWRGYGAVSAAKAALEAYCRQLAVELAPLGITANAIQAGVTDTPAARKIPGFDSLKANAIQRNPYQRLTTPDDVARCVAALIGPETAWLTGNTIGLDGGEQLAG